MQLIKKDFIKFYIIALLLISSVISILVRYPHLAMQKVELDIDIDEIRQRDTLIVSTGYNSISYFIYRGQPMGFQYEMVQRLADALELNVHVLVCNDMEKSFEHLKNGRCDLIAIDLTVTKERNEEFAFTEPHSQTRQVLVQQKPKGWENLDYYALEETLLRDHTELAGKTIYIPTNTSFRPRIESLSDEIGAPIHIVEVPNAGSEQLIEMVSEGKIQYTVADEHSAKVNKFYYKNIDIETPISFTQNLAWAVRKSSPKLLKLINNWLRKFTKSKEYINLYNKYYSNPRAAVDIFESDFYSVKTGKISQYDTIIKEQAEKIGWDWLLLSSLIFQESRFNHELYSWAGAYGLMQLMPITANRFGASIPSSPEENIKAGTQYIQWLDNEFQKFVPEEEERIKFVIAAYNIGHNHINDAIQLTIKYDGDASKWDDVKEFLILKSNPKYYNDPVVKYGYCRGKGSVRMVEDVIKRYEDYKVVFDN